MPDLTPLTPERLDVLGQRLDALVKGGVESFPVFHKEMKALLAAARDADERVRRAVAETVERAAIVANAYYRSASELWSGTPDNYDQGQVDMAEDIERDIRALAPTGDRP